MRKGMHISGQGTEVKKMYYMKELYRCGVGDAKLGI
jgi:hypothetical protein